MAKGDILQTVTMGPGPDAVPFSFSATPTNGDLLVAALYVNANSANDFTCSGWTIIVDTLDELSLSDHRLVVFAKIASSETNSYSIDRTGTGEVYYDCAAWRIEGVFDSLTAVVFDTGRTNAGTSMSLPSPAYSAAGASTAIALIGALSGIQPVTASGWTIGTSGWLNYSSRVFSSAGDIQAAATWTLTEDATGVMVVAAHSIPAAPALTAGPTITDIVAGGFTVNGTADQNCTVSVVVVDYGDPAPSSGDYDASAFTESATADTPFAVEVTL